MSQKFVNLENLTSFWGNAKEYIDNERQKIEDQLYNWQKTEKASVVQCEPVPDSELHPTIEFKFKEILPEGEKGLDNPSTITGISSFKIGRCGKNFVGPVYARSASDVAYTNNSDGSVTFNGTASSNYFYFAYTFNALLDVNLFPEFLERGKTYTFSMNASSNVNNVYFEVFISRNKASWGKPILKIYPEQSGQFTIPQDTTGMILRYVVLKNTTISNVTIKAQIEEGTQATTFEKSNFNEYTINLNDTYYSGSVDLVTGLMTVTQKGHIFDGTETLAVDSNHGDYYHYAYLFDPSSQAISYIDITNQSCTHLAFVNNTFYTSMHFVCTPSQMHIFTTHTTKASLLSWFEEQYQNETPVTLVYTLGTPQIIQLDSIQLKALSSLEGTSKRINTIYTNVDFVQVEYQKYVGIDSTLNSSSVNAIQNKVVNNALNTKVSLTGDETIAGFKTFSSPINGSVTGDAGTVAGHIVSKDVPVNAVFTDTTYDPATQSTAGLMSASDKVKLDAVGSIFSFKGSVIDDTYLPTSDNVNGDAYLAEDTGHVHVYNGTNFVDIGIWAGIPSATDAQIDALFED